MLFLDAALAFAVTMLVVATVVAKIVDFIYGTMYLRNQLFEEMLGRVQDAVAAQLGDLQTTVEASVQKLKARETRSWGRWIWQYVSGQLPTKASINDFIKSASADAAKDENVQKLKAILKEEGDKVTDYLRKRTRWVAFLVALVLALVLNIDSVNIADRYIQTPSLSAAIAGNADSAIQESRKALASTAKLEADATPVQEAATKSLNESVEKLQEQIDKLNASSFPIGQSYFPYWPYTKAPTPSWEVRLRWLAGIMLTCLCAGLGTPFWYDLIGSLTKLTQAGKGKGSQSAP